MASTVFPAPTSSSSSVNAFAATLPAPVTKYKQVQNFAAGVYTITSSPTHATTVTFFDASSKIVEATTSSGTITVNLASPATYCILSSVTASVVVSITLTANPLVSNTLSGTLDAVTATGNYNTTGPLYVYCLAGGRSGSGGNSGGPGGSGGATGGQVSGLVYTNAATLVTVGGSNGTTSFGNLLVANNQNSVPGAVLNNVNASVMNTITPELQPGSTGSGGVGATYSNGGDVGRTNGAVGNIGTGGAGGNGSGPGGAGTGYGSGGGGAGFASNIGGAGGQGIAYILRGF